jgi:hypothetical protein
MVDLMRKCVRLVLEVILKIVYVEIAVGKGLPWCEMEVSNNFVDTDATL